MATTINADTSNGLKITSDTSGIVEIQNAGTTKLTVNSSGATVAGTLAATAVTGDGSALTGIETGVSWQSSVVTASTLTAVAGRGYWIDTTSNICTVTLPSSASVGDQIIFTDFARTWATNNVVVNSNSLKYQGEAVPSATKEVKWIGNGQSNNIIYSGATKGWIPNTDEASALAPSTPAFSATGGTIVTYSGYKAHVFTSSADFVVTGSRNVDRMIVAGAASVVVDMAAVAAVAEC